MDHGLRWFNGAPGLLVFMGETLVTAFHFVINDQGIRRIYALSNPDKLRLFSSRSGRSNKHLDIQN